MREEEEEEEEEERYERMEWMSGGRLKMIRTMLHRTIKHARKAGRREMGEVVVLEEEEEEAVEGGVIEEEEEEEFDEGMM